MMASVNFKKLKTATEVAGMIRHDDKDTRLEAEHSNEDIDKTMTKQNLQFSKTYEQTFEKYLFELSKLDAANNANRRKDRVTAFSLYVPMVPGIPADQKVKYAKTVNKALAEVYPEAVILNSYWHFDEKHEYTDPETGEKRMSLDHGHVLMMPIVDGKLNAKAFSSRANMIKVNNTIHKAIQEEFGVPFMDGSGKKSKGSVENLKMASKKAELKQRETRVKAREDAVKEKETVVGSREVTVAKREKAVGEAEVRLKETQDLYDGMLDELNELKSQLTDELVRQHTEDVINKQKNKRKNLEEKFKADIVDSEYIEAKQQDDDDVLDKYFPRM